MKSMKTVSSVRYQIIKYMLFTAILLCVVFRLKNSIFPATTADEFGYMYHAAKMSGWDWKELVQYYPYYGIGIGLIWVPFFRVFSSTTLIYQSIVVLNGVFLALSFLISIKCADTLFKDWNKWIKLASCFCITLYPSNFFYARVALSETLLYLLFWICFFMLLKFIETRKVRWIVGLSIFSGYMILVHLRTLGIALIMLTFVCYFCVKNKELYRNIVVILIALLIAFGLSRFIQTVYYNSLGGSNSSNVANASIPIKGIISTFFMNVGSSIKGGMGHAFYYLISGGICGACGLIYIFKKNFLQFKFLLLKKDDIDCKNDIYTFLLIEFILNFIVFFVNPHESILRYDVAVSGRYLENIMGPILLCGFYFITNCCKIMSSYIEIYILGIIGCMPFLIRNMNNAVEPIFASDSAPALGGFFSFDMTNLSIDFSLIKILCITIGMFCFLGMICRIIMKKTGENKYIIGGIALISVAVYWSYLGIQSESNFTKQRLELYSEYKDMKVTIEEYGCEDILFVQDIPDSRNSIKYLQFLFKEKIIDVKKSEELEASDDKKAIFCNKNEHIMEFEEGYEVKEYTKMNLYLKKEYYEE